MRPIVVQVPARLEYLGLLKATVPALAELYPPERRPRQVQLQAWALAIYEAATNIVRHGQDGSGERVITLRIVPHTDRVVFWLEDEGPPNPLPVLAPALTDEHGRGLQIIRALMDEVAYTRDGRHNRLQLAARLG